MLIVIVLKWIVMVDFNNFEQYFKSREVFHDVRVSVPFIIRVDGNNFHQVAKDLKLKKPFDETFHELMVQTVKEYMRSVGFNVILAYTFSDEISYLYLTDAPFNGRMEKLLTIATSYTASILTNKLHEYGYRKFIGFDGRIVKVNDVEEIINYLIWRSMHSYRNFLNSYAQAYIHGDLTHVKGSEIIKKLSMLGIDVNSVSCWERFGTIVIKERYVKEGVNRLTGARIKVFRTKLTQHSIDFTKKDSQEFIYNLLMEHLRK